MFGQVLRNARENAGLTQEKLSFEAGLDRRYISHLENDYKSPTLTVLFRLCEALNVAPSSLIRLVEESEGFRNKNVKK